MDELLSKIGSPADVKRLTIPQLTQLAAEIRERLIVGVSKTGGHIGPNLGVVELTLAMHYVFDTPRDSFVFDVSHQSYVHKMLTGRNDKFGTIRQPGGLNGCHEVLGDPCLCIRKSRKRQPGEDLEAL